MKKSAGLRCLIIAVLCGVLSAPPEPAQAQAFHRIYHFGSVSEMSWSTDGRLSFKAGWWMVGDNAPTEKWYEYYPEAQMLIEVPAWPRQPNLSADELAFFRPLKDQDTGQINTYMFSSPNSRYVVFPSEIGGTWIADRQTRQMAETYIDYGGDHLSGFNVVWNRTGTVFIITADNYSYCRHSGNVIAYMTNFTEDVNAIQTMSGRSMNLTVDGMWHAPEQLYGIADDGKYVLLHGYGMEAQTSRTYCHLLRWNADTNTAIIIGDFDSEQVGAAMFEDGDPDRIVVLSERGVSRFRISDGYHQILSDQWTVNDSFPRGVFSYDGRWLAVDGGSRGLFVFDLHNDFIGLKSQHYVDPSTQLDESEFIFAHLNVVNTGDWPLELGKIKLRYYLNSWLDQYPPMDVVCWTAMLQGGCDNVILNVGVFTDLGSTLPYIEVGFKQGTLAAHSETREIAVRVNNQDWSNFDQTSHFSFNFSNSDTFADSLDIPVYYDGKMVWGLEPE